MALIQINWNPSRRELRQFGAILLPAFLAAIGGFILYRGGSVALTAALGGAAILSAIIGWLFPAAFRPLYVGWMCAAFPIGWTISHLLLAVIFYVVITPIGWLLRLFGRDPMQRRFDRSAKTYWIPHAAETDSRRYFRQF